MSSSRTKFVPQNKLYNKRVYGLRGNNQLYALTSVASFKFSYKIVPLIPANEGEFAFLQIIVSTGTDAVIIKFSSYEEIERFTS